MCPRQRAMGDPPKWVKSMLNKFNCLHSKIFSTDTALGTLASYWPRCKEARRKPKAEDFIDVSMAMVRHDTSSKPSAAGSA